MSEPALNLPPPSQWLFERGREARQLAAMAPEGEYRASLLAVVAAMDHALEARGLPTVEDLEHWNDPPLSAEETAFYMQTLETGEGPWPES